jgi:hypothetical protein
MQEMSSIALSTSSSLCFAFQRLGPVPNGGWNMEYGALRGYSVMSLEWLRGFKDGHWPGPSVPILWCAINFGSAGSVQLPHPPF